MLKRIIAITVAVAFVGLLGCAKHAAPVNAGNASHHAYQGNGKLNGKLGR